MKKILLTAVTLASIATFTYAQSDEAQEQKLVTRTQVSPEERAKMMTERINSIVKLTPEQYTKVMALSKNSATEVVSNRLSSTAGDNAAGNQVQVTARPTVNFMEEVNKILTKEQITKLEEARATESDVAQPMRSSVKMQQANPAK